MSDQAANPIPYERDISFSTRRLKFQLVNSSILQLIDSSIRRFINSTFNSSTEVSTRHIEISLIDFV